MRHLKLAFLLTGIFVSGSIYGQSLPEFGPPGPVEIPTSGAQSSFWPPSGGARSDAYSSMPSALPPALPTGEIGPQIWGGVDYLLWWMKDTRLPPIAVIIPDSSANQPTFNASESTTVFPKDSTGTGPFSGMRATLGGWFTPDQRLGGEVVYYQLFEKNEQFNIASNGSPVIGRFFNNLESNRGSVLLFSNPTTGLRGSINTDYATSLHSGEANLLMNMTPILVDQLVVLGGFRYFDIQQRIRTSETSVEASGDVALTSSESFDVKNRFYGGQIGTKWIYQGPRWTLDTTLKLAVGAMNHKTDINGATSITDLGVTTNYVGDVLAQPTNIGSRSSTSTAVIPEINLKLGYRITPWAHVHAGYDFLYVTEVATLGSTIDTGVNPNLIPPGGIGNNSFNGARPTSRNNFDDFWLQGMTFGMTFQY